MIEASLQLSALSTKRLDVRETCAKFWCDWQIPNTATAGENVALALHSLHSASV